MNLFFTISVTILLNQLDHINSQTQEYKKDDLIQFKPLESYVELKGGDFLMGINDREGYNYEYPQRKGIVKPMRVMLYPVSIASFKRYKQQKYKHRTDAEIAGYSWVFKQLLNKKAKLNEDIDNSTQEAKEAIANEMLSVIETRWNRPEGGDSLVNDRLEHPVVHVSYSDASAFCTWKGMRLPNEIEWEFAARGGLKEKIYPWGDYWQLKRTNLWQGNFPEENQLRDGFFGLAPVTAFAAQNQYEMYDLIGNVWEWTSTIFRDLRNKTDRSIQRRCLKGGSFLDTRDGDYRTDSKLKIRLSSRMGKTEKYTAQNVGFRCVQSINDSDMNLFMRNLDGKDFRVVKLRPPVYHRHPDSVAAESAERKNQQTLLKSEL